MELHLLKPAEGSVKNRKRVARGQGSGAAGTAGRGHKGDGSRSGSYSKRGFEGGQMPLHRRLPKKGFKNINRVEYVAINIGRLEEIAEKFNVTTINTTNLFELGIISRNDKIKILGSGELTKSLSVSAHAFSESAKLTIEQKGGNVNLV
ncbi:MAG: 50S ribosomal protein L15 [Saprospiraceae bacterium]|jgi:large subunit ribosomal protein L15|nr:50S ribosomal protein L15 [Saprospiraceae bacterium]